MVKRETPYLKGILALLAINCGQQIYPLEIILEATPENTRYHFRVPNSSRRQIVGWAKFRVRPSTKVKTKQASTIVSIYGELLNDHNQEYQKRYFCNSNFGNLPELVQCPICATGNTDYQLALQALIEASKNLASGNKYTWYNKPCVTNL